MRCDVEGLESVLTTSLVLSENIMFNTTQMNNIRVYAHNATERGHVTWAPV